MSNDQRTVIVERVVAVCQWVCIIGVLYVVLMAWCCQVLAAGKTRKGKL